MKTHVCWFALAAVALSLATAGDARQTPDPAAATATTESRDDAQVHRRGWRNWLPALLQPATTTLPTPTPPAVVETADPCLPAPPPDAPQSLPPVGTVEEEQSRFFKAVGERLIAPGYAAFASTTQALASTASDYCAASGSSNSDTPLRGAWKCAMTAWQRVQHLRTGPVEEDNRRLRIQFFPDGNRAAQRNLAGLLYGTAAITEEVVRNTAAGAQGFPALERLIFGSETLRPGSRRCQAAVAIAANLRTMADEIAAPWQSDGALLQAFEGGDDPFLDRNDVLTAILESIAVQGEFIADEKIRRAMRAEDASRLESPLAAHSKENVATNLGALAELIDDEQAGAYRLRHYLLRVHDERAVGDQLATGAARAQERIASLTAGFETAVVQQASADRERLQGLFDDFQRLSALAEDAAVAAGVNLGFNSQDGD